MFLTKQNETLINSIQLIDKHSVRLVEQMEHVEFSFLISLTTNQRLYLDLVLIFYIVLISKRELFAQKRK